MKFSSKLSLTMVLASMVILALGVSVQFKSSYDSTLESELLNTQHWATEKSFNIDHLLTARVGTATTLGNTPLLKDALIESNLSLASLSEDQRKQFIDLENNKWKSISDPSDNFILKFIDNSVAQVLKNQQTLFDGKYGEIFLTNKYGALIASTAKLSTYAHGMKYWWLGAFNQGAGAVFIDDRGYDDSVGGYVLGIVVPIRDGDEVIGILKCNLNILGDLGDHVIGMRDNTHREYTLVRSGGLVVTERGVEPLSARISKTVQENITLKQSGSLIENVSGAEKFIGFSEVNLSKGNGKFRFGGSFESPDHKKGNIGESWYIICKRPLDEVMAPIYESYQSSIKIGISIILVMVIVSFLYGRTISRPLTLINNATIRVRDGDFDSRIKIQSNDEFGNLADHFNLMVEKIRQMTQELSDSNVNLENRVEKRTEDLEREVDQRKRSEAALQKSEEGYRLLAENSSDVIFLLDIGQQRFKYISPAIYRLRGLTVEEALNESMSDSLTPESLELVTSLIYRDVARLIKNPDNPLYSTTEVRQPHKNGSLVWVEISTRYRVNDSGEVELIGVSRNIDERKQLEEQLRKSQKLEAIGTMVGGVAHEFNNALQSLFLYGGMVEDGLPDDKAVVEDFKGLMKTANDAKRLVEQVMLITSVDSGKQEQIELPGLIDDVINIKLASTPSSIVPKLTIADHLPTVLADKKQIQIIVENVIENAILAMPDGGVLTVNLGDGERETEKSDQVGVVLLTISDTGVGMTEDILGQIFNPFFTTREIGQGKGFGLSIVYNFLQNMGGSISVTSVPGKGSSFQLEIPVQDQSEV
jgi:PAS domain S-box-containing protein